MSNPERPHPSQREIQLGEEFFLFDKRFREPEHPGTSNFGYLSQRSLTTGIIPPIDFVSTTRVRLRGEFDGLESTPFNPKLTYRFSKEDNDKEAKTQKLKNLPLHKELLEENAPLNPKIRVLQDLSNLDLLYTLNEDKEKLFRRLRIQLFFPDSDYEGRVDKDLLSSELDINDFLIDYFYPTDIPNALFTVRLAGGLMAVDPERVGHPLNLPNNPEKLSQIRAKFFLAQEENSNRFQ